MSALSKFLRSADGGIVMYWCPGCGCAHGLATGEGDGPRWSFNGDAERPTFSPSVLSTWTDWGGAEPVQHTCHAFVEEGRIRFLGDCTHELRGQTVDLPEWP
jgi:hypothetical protein